MTSLSRIPERTLISVLTQVKSSKNTNLLSNDQITKLSQVRYVNGENIFTLTPDNRSLIYFMLNQIEKYGFDTVYSFLTSKRWTSKDELFFASPILEEVRQKVRTDNQIFKNKIEVQSSQEACRKCNSHETLIMVKQTRGADEPMSTYISCLACGTLTVK